MDIHVSKKIVQLMHLHIKTFIHETVLLDIGS